MIKAGGILIPISFSEVQKSFLFSVSFLTVSNDNFCWLVITSYITQDSDACSLLNVCRDKGEICTAAIESNWVPTLNAKFVLEAVRSILLDPTEAANNPIENEIAQEYLTNKTKYDATAAQWVQQYAK